MSSFDKKDSQTPPTAAAAGNGNGVAAAMKPAAISAAVDGIRQTYGDRRLRINPNKEHKADKYDDLKSEFDPAVYSSLEKHMPPSLLGEPRDTKFHFIQEILRKYIPDGERARVSC